jgi:hypothetical protein
MSPTDPDLLQYIIHEYLQGRITATEAAQDLFDKFAENFAIQVTPSIRPILSELHRLRTGQPMPPFELDPKRHVDGNLNILNRAEESLWTTVVENELNAEPVILGCFFYAATEVAARRVGEWLQAEGHAVRIKTPVEADADDWFVSADTPSEPISRERLTTWLGSLRMAPLQGEASIGGYSVAGGN